MTVRPRITLPAPWSTSPAPMTGSAANATPWFWEAFPTIERTIPAAIKAIEPKTRTL